jgi:hypothetical protein
MTLWITLWIKSGVPITGELTGDIEEGPSRFSTTEQLNGATAASSAAELQTDKNQKTDGAAELSCTWCTSEQLL